MIRLTGWTLGEAEQEVEPATDSRECPPSVFFLAEELQKPIREKTGSCSQIVDGAD